MVLSGVPGKRDLSTIRVRVMRNGILLLVTYSRCPLMIPLIELNSQDKPIPDEADAVQLYIEMVDARVTAREAFIYAYPMIQHYSTLYKHIGNPKAQEYTGGFGCIRSNADPSSPANHDVITPNNDTPYSWLWLDLRAEPWIFSVPAVTLDRYYSVQFIDLYTFNFAYIGVRSTGFAAGNYLITGPDWHGSKPANISQVFSSETSIVLALVRTQLNGPDDVVNVKAIQAQYKAEPLSSFEGTEAPIPSAPISFVPYDEVKAQSSNFIEYLNWLLKFCQPPHESEVTLRERFNSIGIGPGVPWKPAIVHPTLLAAIEEGVTEAQAFLEVEISKTVESNGLFGSREHLRNDYMARAVGAAMGLYGNSQEEAWYAGFVGDGNTLRAMHFSPGHLPPAKFFWSFTLYTLPDRYLYANERNRYSIGDRTPNLKISEDGSLTIYIGHQPPGSDRESNWLPAPAGNYSLVTRIYGPKSAALDGSWKLPDLQAADQIEGSLA